ncbi:FG-GAP repeat domain-containing protein [Sinomicrobium soli]|uniref:FG-GAP repeat domain-containing protein n=1 Tax=Sinomicrobium sp. N-1-3-6 TaxID=2219864 RepID=UPI000DCC4C65|nr:VCBS repeat-containing protein [Sinomicrobium sp. N-1-3-6]RAV30350.1 VCBS repeat-containing protein [Sinomicrobium sp. N-1-3-6]
MRIFKISLFLLLGLSSCNEPDRSKPAQTTEDQSGPDNFKIIKFNNPGLEVDLGVGLWASPIPMDFDGDGDLDLLVSCTDAPYSGTYLFENKSEQTDGSTVFEKPVRVAEGIRNVSVSYIGDEPRILGPGLEYEDFRKQLYNQPLGIFNAHSILKDFPKRRFSQWQYVDYENDGDLDLIMGVDDWEPYGWDEGFDENGKWKKGDLHGYVYLITNENGKMVNKGKLKTAKGKPLDVYGNTTPNIEDFDGDGDLDIICGEFVDTFTWFENTGSRENPEYAEGRLLSNEDGLVAMDLEMMKPVALDWNGDGTIDLIVGDEDGRVAFIENTGKKEDNMPVFKSPVYLKQKADDVKFGGLVTPYSVDWDGDGDEDLICGNTAGYIGFIENLGNGNDGFPKWAAPEYLKADGEIIRILAGENGSIQGPAERKWGYTTLSVADWDGDGLHDIIINSIWGKVEWYKNVGTRKEPRLAKRESVKVAWGDSDIPKPAWNWWNPGKEELSTQWRTTPFATDWNRNGLTDLIMLDHEGYLAFYERFKNDDGELYLKPGKRIFKDENGSDLRLSANKAGGSGRRKLTFTDWDGDGDLDLLVNGKNVDFYENTGDKDGQVRFENRGPVSPQRLAGHTTSPTTVDWDGDGVRDLLVGAEDGHLYWLENKGK